LLTRIATMESGSLCGRTRSWVFGTRIGDSRLRRIVLDEQAKLSQKRVRQTELNQAESFPD
jgi:hypothetical protein